MARFSSSRRGRISESRFEAWASWAVIKTHRALLQVLDCIERLALFIRKRRSAVCVYTRPLRSARFLGTTLTLAGLSPPGCAARCAGSQDFVVPSAQRCPENWTRYPTPALRLPRSTPCHGDHLRGRPSWRKRAGLREPREKLIRIFLSKRICFEVLFNLNRHGFPCGTLTESIWEWISARRQLSLSLIGPHCRHSSPGIMRFMNASNKGTVKAVSP